MQHDGQTDSGRGNLPASVASNLQRDDVPSNLTAATVNAYPVGMLRLEC